MVMRLSIGTETVLGKEDIPAGQENMDKDAYNNLDFGKSGAIRLPGGQFLHKYYKQPDLYAPYLANELDSHLTSVVVKGGG